MRRYAIVYADPPWKYGNGGTNVQWGTAASHYPTMKLGDICSLPVEDITADDCVLFLWVTFPMLREAFKVISAWGFTYKTVAFVWVKRNRKANSWFWGLGNWTRSNAEICLLAVKGKPKRLSNRVHQVIYTPIEGHSKKPEEARRRIVQLMGDLPRVELFARQSPEGWDVWGNEVCSDDKLTEVLDAI